MSLRIYGNRLLRTPGGLDTRPTLGRVRTAVFGRWHGRVEGCRWLDLCAGAGTMGAEALARGAAEAVGIEQAAGVARIAAANWDKIAPGRGTVYKTDALTGIARLGRQGRVFDLIYFDPPYRGELYLPVLEAVGARRLLEAGGELAAEHSEALPDLPEVTGSLVRLDRRVYGGTVVSYYGFLVEAEASNS
ncbi:16S rRNA (guanine(966)-N(2))-methyltransferase RsmD [Gloeobacter morelensis]|uniref:16S rRNA (Guanine(966)-N(2))-methyltransferase RsmD n=1 Tax=Gloeobacter morelensis MG652769 TaxID=2781736 RepID=A0ABY3PKF8_9CYAN|nr:16S rRNA (guanine(966)-N(2))-methyltransferase RsmD [Gloeobacter morelensis]UFP94109.1 16S rRNA (guanine(966)-N(2))-methyltransferase RsmD [Gloeobacter morelensis MG652769]